MKRQTSHILLLGGLCAACCAWPLALPLLGTVLAGSISTIASESVAWVAGFAAIAVSLVLYLCLRRPDPGKRPAADDGCGCSSSGPPMACTLAPFDLRERLAWIEDLARTSLLEARQEGAVLRLRYAKEAVGRVHEMVEQERACCAFLHFAVREEADCVHVAITAPEEASEAALALFAHFAPELTPPDPSQITKEPVQS